MSSSKTHSAQNANSQEPKLPSVLFCYGCEKEKPIHSFSKTQITKAMSNIHNRYAPKGRTTKRHHTTCKQCTPQQNTSLTCMVCTKTMPLDKFAKAQRKNAEKARCIECMKKQQDEDTDDSEDYDESEDGSYNETWDDIL
ncbi:Stc1 domain-containing protein [Gigaspora rosea]|uniref:Stc1 domain-containing protein n=2 Tax=Gigaspora TaxID=4873 RepID=A0A397W1D3_9GLOM|nr:lim-like protein linking chromatin modification to rnai, stc1 [Gigaspora margarita]RIB28008.1 Stc1 domain-containing protein [Gigaspora rosea]